LDEGTGTAVGDASGNGNHGALEGGGKWTTGKLDGGVYLDGVDDYIEIPNVIGEAGTLGFWFKPDWDGSDPADYRLFDASLGGIYFFISKGANHADINPEDFGFYLEDATDADYQGIEIDPTGVIFADTWYHVAVTWEFGGGPAILYLDGQEIARAATIGPFPALYENPRFGLQTIDYIASANGAKSVIDDIAIFDRALTAEEIQTTMSGLGEYPWAWGMSTMASPRHSWAIRSQRTLLSAFLVCLIRMALFQEPLTIGESMRSTKPSRTVPGRALSGALVFRPRPPTPQTRLTVPSR
jgi:hypothetical protein